MIHLTPKHKKQLKAQAHQLNPIVIIGNNGLTENVIKEINRGLEDHELIKTRIQDDDRQRRRDLSVKICEITCAQLIQIIGKVCVLFRDNNDVLNSKIHKRTDDYTKD